MHKNISKENYEKLLDWLDENEARAFQEYNRIRRTLVNIFLARGCFEADDLADETIDRVAAKIESIEAVYKGEKTTFFVGVLKNVYKEWMRKQSVLTDLSEFKEKMAEFNSPIREDVEYSIEAKCLKKCLAKLNKKEREVVLAYYQPTGGQEKIVRHKILANKFSKSINSLRVQAFRIRQKLSECIEECVERQEKM